jgi:cell cycle checkpoint protein
VSSQVASLKSANPPRILLFTSLPNLSHVPTREVFQRALIDYTKSYSTTSCPLVIIVPDAGSSGAAEESWNGADRGGEASWDLRTVLGKDLTASPAVGVVE